MEQNQMNNDEIEIDLREIFSVLLSHLGIIILSGLVLGLVAIVRNESIYYPSVSVCNQDVCAGKTEQRYTDQRRYGRPVPCSRKTMQR